MADLKNIILVGPVDAGKSALTACLLNDEKVNTGKTQSPNYYKNQVIDTPGEFIDNHNWKNAFLTLASSANTILYLQPAIEKRFAAVPGLLNVYAGKNIVGVITKVDLDNADIDKAKIILEKNRIKGPYFAVSINDQNSIRKLREYLISL